MQLFGKKLTGKQPDVAYSLTVYNENGPNWFLCFDEEGNYPGYNYLMDRVEYPNLIAVADGASIKLDIDSIPYHYGKQRNPKVWKPAMMQVEFRTDSMGSLIVEPVSARRKAYYAKEYAEWHSGNRSSSIYIQDDWKIDEAFEEFGVTAEEADEIVRGYTITRMVSVDAFDHLFGLHNEVPMD